MNESVCSVDNMKHAVSNILWGNSASEPYLEILASKGCYGIEIAPSLFWTEPVESSKNERKKLKNMIQGYGLEIVSFHALLYTRPDLKIFADQETRQKTKEYLLQLGYLAADMGCPLMVLGAPKNRTKSGRNEEEVSLVGIDFFSSLADRLSSTGVILCIEPLCRQEADFITSSSEGLAYVKEVDHPNFRLMLDAKSMHMENEDYNKVVAECIDCIEHVHANDPGNSPLGSKGVDHRAFGQALRANGYDKVISLEVGRGFGDPVVVIRDCLEKMRNYY